MRDVDLQEMTSEAQRSSERAEDDQSVHSDADHVVQEDADDGETT